MSDLRTAAQQALEALEWHLERGAWGADIEGVTGALRAALAQQDEPVAWLQPKTVNAYSRPDLGYESCSSADYGAFPVYRAPPKAEPAQKPAAVVGTQVDVWRGWDVRWAPPGEPIKTALMLKDMPVGTMLYAAPPKRQPLTEQVDLSRCPQCNGPADNGHDRSIPPNPYFCSKCMDEPVADQTLDEAMRLPRAMAQAYESGYNAGVAHERERCLRLIDEHVRAVDAEDLVRAIKEGKE